jgi:hypothetical protein
MAFKAGMCRYVLYNHLKYMRKFYTQKTFSGLSRGSAEAMLRVYCMQAIQIVASWKIWPFLKFECSDWLCAQQCRLEEHNVNQFVGQTFWSKERKLTYM